VRAIDLDARQRVVDLKQAFAEWAMALNGAHRDGQLYQNLPDRRAESSAAAKDNPILVCANDGDDFRKCETNSLRRPLNTKSTRKRQVDRVSRQDAASHGPNSVFPLAEAMTNTSRPMANGGAILLKRLLISTRCIHGLETAMRVHQAVIQTTNCKEKNDV
jgi:hypothetical protein